MSLWTSSVLSLLLLQTVLYPAPSEEQPRRVVLVKKDWSLAQAYSDVFKILSDQNPCSSFYGGSRAATTVLNDFVVLVQSQCVVINDAGNCYVGTCAPATECKTVSGCGSCTGANDACASYETQLGIQHHCITIPPECGGSASCSCFGAATCLSPYRSCREYSGLRGVYCSCPNC